MMWALEERVLYKLLCQEQRHISCGWFALCWKASANAQRTAAVLFVAVSASLLIRGPGNGNVLQ